tara:strand:- start:82 stop:1527 length:1446 start_codon:yes stop_codon:yes gene_type:complete
MKLDWGQEVGERWIPFNGWLQNNYGLYRLNKLNKKEKISVIKQYLSDQGLTDIRISRWDQNKTIVKFKTNFTGKYWHQSTWYGLQQRGRKGNRLDPCQTIIIEEVIKDFTNFRGTPFLRMERSNGRHIVYFYSPRYNWICSQNWHAIRSGVDINGNVLKVSPSNWFHDFRSVCGQTEFIENLIWSKFKGIIDDGWEYKKPRDSIPCTSFDGYRHLVNMNAILTEQTNQLNSKNAEDKTKYLKEYLARNGYLKTGYPYKLDEEIFDIKKWNPHKPIPYFQYDEIWGWERYRIYFGHIPDKSRVNKRLEGVWDKTDFIRNRFLKVGYEIPKSWKYVLTKREQVRHPIPFKFKNKWYRISWDYFNSGMRVDIEKYLYFVKLKVDDIECLKLGVTMHDLKKRYGTRLQEIYYETERRPEPLIKEVEDVLLHLTRKYSIQYMLPDDFDGRTECRSMDMDINKTKEKIKTVFKSIDKKWESLPEIKY